MNLLLDICIVCKNSADKYNSIGKKVKLRHLTRDCHKLLSRAGQLVVDSDDDPDYGVAVDYDIKLGIFGKLMEKNHASFYGLPKNVIFCKHCVLSNQRPSSVPEFIQSNIERKGTLIHNDGICNACKYNNEKKKIDWEKREQQLIKLLDEHKKKVGYDVIVPGSGGKDSGFAAHILKYKYGMNPLTVTWAPHLYTDIGLKNFQNWMYVGGLDNFLYTPNGKIHRYLTSQAFKNLLHPFQPFIVGQKIIGPLMSEKFNVPLVMYGESNAENGDPIEETKIPTMDKKFFLEQDHSKIKLAGKTIEEIIKKEKFRLNDFTPYIPSDEKDMKKNNTQVHHLGYYLKWNAQENFYYSSTNTGFLTNDQRTEGSYSKYSSFDDKVDSFHWYTYFIKFGIGRATHDACQEIRHGTISRDEAVKLVNKFDHEFPQRYFRDFLDYINISEKEFWETIDKFRSPHLWERKNNEWILKATVKNLI
jgi:N-acetyl sugar amidotransferase